MVQSSPISKTDRYFDLMIKGNYSERTPYIETLKKKKKLICLGVGPTHLGLTQDVKEKFYKTIS